MTRLNLDKQGRPTISEDEYQGQVIELAHDLNWTVAHFRPARMKGKDGEDRWATPVQADGAGFPDLLMVSERQERLIVMELKSATGKVSDAQNNWLQLFAAVTRRPEVYVARPSDFDEIKELLR